MLTRGPVAKRYLSMRASAYIFCDLIDFISDLILNLIPNKKRMNAPSPPARLITFRFIFGFIV
jgi:hypothetical protein